MKILAIGDPHGELPKNLDKIISKNKIELIICTGDYSNVKIISKFSGITNNKDPKIISSRLAGFNLPILTLKGNMYNNRKFKKIFTNAIKKYPNIYYKTTGKIILLKQTFILFDVLYERHNARSKLALSLFGSNKKREKKLNNFLSKNPNSILISHNPPYGYVDKAYNGKHVGSKILLNAIKKNKPKLVLCGHIHEAKGKRMINKTPVYNLGSHGDYAVFDVGKKIQLVESNFLNQIN